MKIDKVIAKEQGAGKVYVAVNDECRVFDIVGETIDKSILQDKVDYARDCGYSYLDIPLPLQKLTSTTIKSLVFGAMGEDRPYTIQIEGRKHLWVITVKIRTNQELSLARTLVPSVVTPIPYRFTTRSTVPLN